MSVSVWWNITLAQAVTGMCKALETLWMFPPWGSQEGVSWLLNTFHPAPLHSKGTARLCHAPAPVTFHTHVLVTAFGTVFILCYCFKGCCIHTAFASLNMDNSAHGSVLFLSVSGSRSIASMRKRPTVDIAWDEISPTKTAIWTSIKKILNVRIDWFVSAKWKFFATTADKSAGINI